MSFDWKKFGFLGKWSVIGGGCIGEVVTHNYGGLTVIK